MLIRKVLKMPRKALTQAVSDKNIVTANGSATLEFAKEVLLLLENDTLEHIEMYYKFNKDGFCLLFPNQ